MLAAVQSFGNLAASGIAGVLWAASSPTVAFGYLLDQALKQGRSWKDHGCEQPISVNLSARSLVDSDLPSAVAELLQRYDIAGSSLTFEITETAIIADHESATAIFTAFHALGMGLSIDDFGTGYFSLSELRSLPIDEIKIDRSVVSAMPFQENDAFIVRSIIALGQNLGMHVVAEGVEDQAALDELRRLGCDYAQGFLISRPLSGDGVIPWIRAWQHDDSSATPFDRPEVRRRVAPLGREAASGSSVSL